MPTLGEFITSANQVRLTFDKPVNVVDTTPSPSPFSISADGWARGVSLVTAAGGGARLDVTQIFPLAGNQIQYAPGVTVFEGADGSGPVAPFTIPLVVV